MKNRPWEEDPSELLKKQDTDAQHWAQSFMSRIEQGFFTKEEIDESLMIVWFANAIENAKDAEGRVYQPDEVVELLDDNIERTSTRVVLSNAENDEVI